MRDRAAPIATPPARSWIGPAFAVVAALLALFFLLARLVVFDGRTGLDHTVTLRVHTWVTPDRTTFMRAVTALGASWFAAIICGGVVLWCFWQRRFRTVAALAGVFLFAKLLEVGFKSSFARPRPTIVPHLVDAGGYSFPSGHAITATITWGLLAAVLTCHLRGRLRMAPPVVAAVVIAAVGFSRIYLGVHYLTDVIAGTLLAAACLVPAIAALCLLDCPVPTSPDRREPVASSPTGEG